MIGTKSRRKLRDLIGPLDREPDPKTLEECRLEAGGFPFVARAVVGMAKQPGDTTEPISVGTELTFWSTIGRGSHSGNYLTRELDSNITVAINRRRWVLLGHRT